MVRPHLGDALTSIISYVSAFIAKRLGNATPNHADFPAACHSPETSALECIITNGVPALRRIARELLSGDRTGARGRFSIPQKIPIAYFPSSPRGQRWCIGFASSRTAQIRV